MKPLKPAFLLAAAAISAGAASVASAQEATNTPAATQPSAGKLVFQEQLRFTQLSDDPTPHDRSVDEYMLLTRLAYGVTGNFALTLDLPLVYRVTEYGPGSSHAGDRDIDRGLASIDLTGKLRIWQDDPGPVDTRRLSLMAGLGIPLDNDLGPGGLTPMIGAVTTWVHGRHGFNAAARWYFTTGSHHHPLFAGESLSDLLRYDAAYLFRVAPETYTASTTAAWYTMLELNGYHETNGDHELFLSPGLLYEARQWAAEISVQIPVYQSLDNRPETEFRLVLGIRVLF